MCCSGIRRGLAAGIESGWAEGAAAASCTGCSNWRCCQCRGAAGQPTAAASAAAETAEQAVAEPTPRMPRAWKPLQQLAHAAVEAVRPGGVGDSGGRRSGAAAGRVNLAKDPLRKGWWQVIAPPPTPLPHTFAGDPIEERNSS